MNAAEDDRRRPLVTVNILSFNRREELRTTLTKVFAQEYAPLEVIVVDNASTDGSAEMVRTEFPEAILVPLEANIGIAGWNEGFAIARGEFIFVLDDDSYPREKAIGITVDYMQHDASCGVAACHIIQSGGSAGDRWKQSPRGITDFIGCGALLRASLVKQVGGFSRLVFLYAHELDFAMNVYDAGSRVDYLDDAEVIHTRSQSHRKAMKVTARDLRSHYYLIRNMIIIALMHFPVRVIGLKVLRFIIGQLVFCAVNGGFMIAVRASFAGLTTVIKNFHTRHMLTPPTQSVYLTRGFMPGFFGDGVYSFMRPGMLRTNTISK
jgi:hypothetical protein